MSTSPPGQTGALCSLGDNSSASVCYVANNHSSSGMGGGGTAASFIHWPLSVTTTTAGQRVVLRKGGQPGSCRSARAHHNYFCHPPNPHTHTSPRPRSPNLFTSGQHPRTDSGRRARGSRREDLLQTVSVAQETFVCLVAAAAVVVLLVVVGDLSARPLRLVGFDLTEPYVAPWSGGGGGLLLSVHCTNPAAGHWPWPCHYGLGGGGGGGEGVREEKRGIYYRENELRLAGGAGIDISD